jgi:hypothetical protein
MDLELVNLDNPTEVRTFEKGRGGVVPGTDSP